MVLSAMTALSAFPSWRCSRLTAVSLYSSVLAHRSKHSSWSGLSVPGACSGTSCATPETISLASRKVMKRNTCGTVLLVTLAGIALLGTAHADTKNMRIAFSNNYAGNSWRQAMLKSYDIVTKKAVADGVVAAADVFTTADKEVPTQAAQIQNLILQGYNAIVINASSPDALNGAIKQATDAGIVVVSFDGIVTEPSAWRVVVDFKDYGEQEVVHLASWLPKGGNLLEIRGLAGTSIDDAIHAGITQGVSKHPQFKIVNSVEGDWDQPTAQKAVATVLPSLPEIVGVVTQGGDGYGAAQAFLAASRKLPIIIMG